MTTGENNLNPDDKGAVNPVVNPNPTQGKDDQNQTLERIVKLEESLKARDAAIDTLKRQYSGSSEEALRLRAELESLKTKTMTKADEQGFQKRIEEVGYVQAVKELLHAELEPIRTSTESLLQKEADKLLSDFKQKHPGLKGDVLAKFDAELTRLKKVYHDVGEAMEAAFRVVGGEAADRSIQSSDASEKGKSELDKKAEEDKARLAQLASGGDGDRRGLTVSPKASLEKQILDLSTQATQREWNGQDATDLWVKIEGLKAKLNSST